MNLLHGIKVTIMNKQLSIIVPTHNNAFYLDKMLFSFTKQKRTSFEYEILVINNNSNDSTNQVVQKYQSKLPMQLIQENREGLLFGRHTGLKNAKSENLAFLDDDVITDENWLFEVITAFEKYPDYELFASKVLPQFETKPPSWFSSYWKPKKTKNIVEEVSVINLGNKKIEVSPYYVFGCNFLVRKNTLLKCRGFHPDGFPKDKIMFRGDGESHVSTCLMNQKKKALYIPKIIVFHQVRESRMTYEYMIHRAYLQGITDSYTDIRSSAEKNNRKIRAVIQIVKWIKGNISFNVLKRKQYRAYREGYVAHQKTVQDDEQIRQWVLKKDYL
ncbi:MAG: hypothetical protein UX04_C0001G0083 [Microgenomates group bacterium GW2011_GWF2_45_18]|nr:MAG: hypothetical protein UX04_C0001G0083 [Microgenomates group bacterium GW2011_GWF2_45_18]